MTAAFETDRLILREFEAGDWRAVLAYQSDARYLRYYPWMGRTDADAHEFVGMFLSQQAEEPRRKFQFAVTLKSKGRLIGNCGLRMSGAEPSEADIGYELDPQFWGYGYATEAAQEMLRLGFAGFGMRRIMADCLAENVASARVLERIGMRCVVCLRQAEFFKGRWWDSLRYAIDDQEWCHDADGSGGIADTTTETDKTMNDILHEQIAYYRARAGEYDQWFLRQGRYDRGPELNARWFSEADQVRAALDAFAPMGRILELACGTGLWTQHLVRHADSLTALDASIEVLKINRDRVSDAKVRYVQADLLEWKPDGKYDAVFFSFWLSHVPRERFEAFWDLVRDCLAPRGRVFLVDSLYEPTSAASDHHLEGAEAVTQTRRLNDGQEFRIVKIFYEGEELTRRLEALGWRFLVHATENYFLYGPGERDL